MQPSKYAVTFACYNQLEYTQKCIDSMVKQGDDLSRVVIVDNGSIDSTRGYLDSLNLGGLILNKTNLGCGVAWNQGALALQAEWTIIMNNDVIVSPNWIETLIHTAEHHKLKMISPSLIEGQLNYDFDSFSIAASKKMKNSLRIGGKHAVCLAVHESVWASIGYFQPVPKLLGYEDTLFFHEVNKANIPIGMTGASWLHHFGSITQSAMKQEQGLAQNDNLGYRYNYRLLQQNWLQRKLAKGYRNHKIKQWHDSEISQFDMTMHGLRIHNTFEWQ